MTKLEILEDELRNLRHDLRDLKSSIQSISEMVEAGDIDLEEAFNHLKDLCR